MGEGSRNLMTSCHPGTFPAVRIPVSLGLASTSLRRISSGWGFWCCVRHRPSGDSARALGGACPLTPPGRGGPSHPRLERPAGRGSGSSPPTRRAKGPRRVPAGRVRDEYLGTPARKTPRGPWGFPGACSPARTGPAGESGSTLPPERLPAARPPAEENWQDAGRQQGPGRAQGAGGRDHLTSPGGGSLRTRPGGGKHSVAQPRALLQVVRTIRQPGRAPGAYGPRRYVINK